MTAPIIIAANEALVVVLRRAVGSHQLSVCGVCRLDQTIDFQRYRIRARNRNRVVRKWLTGERIGDLGCEHTGTLAASERFRTAAERGRSNLQSLIRTEDKQLVPNDRAAEGSSILVLHQLVYRFREE